MAIKTVLLALLFAMVLSADAPTWTSGTVVWVVNRPSRLVMAGPKSFASAPARVEYTVRIESTDYVLVQVRRLGGGRTQKKTFVTGEAVEISKDGKNYLFLRSATTDQKRLRIVRAVRR